MDEASALEQVLVIPDTRFREAGHFRGFRAHDPNYLKMLLDPTFMTYRPRGQVETDPTFKQLIPYIVLRCGEVIFHYTRGGGGSEQRLRSQRSIGIGGHISAEDGPISGDPYRAGMLRELNEEVDIGCQYREHCLGFIHDDRTPVGEVHVGIVHLFDLEQQTVRPREAAIADAGFSSMDELLPHRSLFETWSQFVLEQLAATRQQK